MSVFSLPTKLTLESWATSLARNDLPRKSDFTYGTEEAYVVVSHQYFTRVNTSPHLIAVGDFERYIAPLHHQRHLAIGYS